MIIWHDTRNMGLVSSRLDSDRTGRTPPKAGSATPSVRTARSLRSVPMEAPTRPSHGPNSRVVRMAPRLATVTGRWSTRYETESRFRSGRDAMDHAVRDGRSELATVTRRWSTRYETESRSRPVTRQSTTPYGMKPAISPHSPAAAVRQERAHDPSRVGTIRVAYLSYRPK